MKRTSFVAPTFVYGSGLALGLAGIGLLFWSPADRSSVLPAAPPRRVANPIDLGPKAAPSTLADRAAIVDAERRGDASQLAKLIYAEKTTPDRGEDARLRVTAIHALANVGGSVASTTLRAILTSPKQELVLRLASAAALARMGEGDLAYLRERLRDEPSRIVKEKIRLSLEGRKS